MLNETSTENTHSKNATQSIAWSIDEIIETAVNILERDSAQMTRAIVPALANLSALREQIKNELRAEFQQEIDNARTTLREEFYRALESLKSDSVMGVPAPLRMPSGW